jgi:uncharacterized damage-inducible protein DinB
MRDVDRLRSEVTSTLAGDPWYGSPVLHILNGIGATAAAAYPIEGAHSIWELVLHMTSWTRETTRRVKGGGQSLPADGDYPLVQDHSAAAWDRAVSELRAAHEELASSLTQIDDAELGRQVGTQVDADGQPVTVHRTVIGILQHDAYHAGQIALLKKAMSD